MFQFFLFWLFGISKLSNRWFGFLVKSKVVFWSLEHEKFVNLINFLAPLEHLLHLELTGGLRADVVKQWVAMTTDNRYAVIGSFLFLFLTSWKVWGTALDLFFCLRRR